MFMFLCRTIRCVLFLLFCCCAGEDQVQLQARGLRNMLHQHRREEREGLPGEGAGVSTHRQDQGMRPARPQIDWGLSGEHEIVCTYNRRKIGNTRGPLRSRRRRLGKRGVQHAPGVTGVGGRYGVVWHSCCAMRCSAVPSSMKSRGGTAVPTSKGARKDKDSRQATSKPPT